MHWAKSVEERGFPELQEFIDRAWESMRIALPLEGLWYNPFTGLVTRGDALPPLEKSLRGGILADEMGLGKTLEVLALVLNNPIKPPAHIKLEAEYPNYDGQLRCFCGQDGDAKDKLIKCCGCKAKLHEICMGLPESAKNWYCPSCVQSSGLHVPLAATIVVSPQAIAQQWLDEIEKHAPSIKVLLYRGVKGVQGDLAKLIQSPKKKIDLRANPELLPILVLSAEPVRHHSLYLPNIAG